MHLETIWLLSIGSLGFRYTCDFFAVTMESINFCPEHAFEILIIIAGFAAIISNSFLTTPCSTVDATDAINYENFRDAVLIAIGISASVFCELCLVKGKSLSETNPTLSPMIHHRFFLFICLQSPLLYFFSLLESKKDESCDLTLLVSQTYPVISAFQLVAMVGYTASITRNRSSNILEQDCLPTLASSPALALFSLALVYQVFCMWSNNIESEREAFSFLIVTKILICFMALNVLVICGYRGFLWLKNRSAEGNKDNILVGICLTMLLLRSVSVVAIAVFHEPLNQNQHPLSATALCTDLYVQSAVILGVVVVPWRLQEWDIRQSMQVVENENSSLLQYIAHEVRSMLNIAQLSISFIVNEEAMGQHSNSGQLASIFEAAQDVDNALKFSIGMLDDVLDFDKMKGKVYLQLLTLTLPSSLNKILFSGGKIELTLENVEAIGEFEALFKHFHLASQANHIHFTFECFQDVETSLCSHNLIRLDPVRFGQVTRNLLTNAFKFTPARGSVRLVLSKVNHSQGGASVGVKEWLRLEVIDSGAGISKENQKKLFGKYAQFNANALQKGGGSGLGLWISKGEWVSARARADASGRVSE